MIQGFPRWLRAALAVAVLMVWTGMAMAQSDPANTRDPALLLQRSREKTRSYDAPIDIDYGMMGVGKKKKKAPAQVEGPDVPEARRGYEYPSVVEPRPTGYSPPSDPDLTGDRSKKNWILPPKPHLDQEDSPYSEDPLEQLLRMYEAEDAARRRTLEGLFSSVDALGLGGAEREEAAADEDDPSSTYDVDPDETYESLLYSEDDGMAAEDATDDLGYSPVISGPVFGDRDDASLNENRASSLSREQLEGLTDEQLAALAEQEYEASTEADDELSLSDEQRPSGIQQFTREFGSDGTAGLRQAQAIMSGSYQASGTGTGAVGATPAAGDPGSWRSSLSTLSSVLSNTPTPSQASSMNAALAAPGRETFGEGVPSSHPAIARIRDQFSSGGNSLGGGLTPAGTTGFGRIGNTVSGPGSLGLGSSLSSGRSPIGQNGIGSGSLDQPARPAPRQRSLDVRSLDILMN